MARKYDTKHLLRPLLFVHFFFLATHSISRPFPFYAFPFLFIELIMLGFNMAMPRQKNNSNNTNITVIAVAQKSHTEPDKGAQDCAKSFAYSTRHTNQHRRKWIAQTWNFDFNHLIWFIAVLHKYFHIRSHSHAPCQIEKYDKKILYTRCSIKLPYFDAADCYVLLLACSIRVFQWRDNVSRERLFAFRS